MAEKNYILLDRAEAKNETEKGLWVQVLIYPDEKPTELFFPFSQVRVESDNRIWVTEWILEQREQKLPEDKGIMTL